MRVLTPRPIQRRMKRMMLYAGKREIGGLLMGEELGDEIFRIVDFSVDSESGTNSRFNRDSDHHDRILDEFFQRTGSNYERYNYLGEWHTHPTFDISPSNQDIVSMHDLVNSSDGLEFSILVIARLKWFYRLEIGGNLFVNNSSPSQIDMIIE